MKTHKRIRTFLALGACALAAVLPALGETIT